MRSLVADDLMTLERYARERSAFRARVLEHKAKRQVAVGPEVMWLFEDRLTVQYQVQEMLRVERIFERGGYRRRAGGLQSADPDGMNLKATMLIEIPDAGLRAMRLAQMKGVEHRCYLEVVGQPGGSERVHRDRGRGSRAGERGQDLGRALPAV